MQKTGILTCPDGGPTQILVDHLGFKPQGIWFRAQNRTGGPEDQQKSHGLYANQWAGPQQHTWNEKLVAGVLVLNDDPTNVIWMDRFEMAYFAGGPEDFTVEYLNTTGRDVQVEWFAHD